MDGLMTRSISLAAAVLASWTMPCLAQVVQLPTYRSFSVRTTVSVPDSGAGFAAGAGTAAHPWRTSGHALPWRVAGGDLALGARQQASGVSVRASVIDQQEMEARLRGSGDTISEPTNCYGSQVGRVRLDAVAASSVEELQRQRAASLQARDAETADWLQRAAAAENEGKLGVARIYYQMVIRRDSGPSGQQARARLRSLDSASR